MACTLAFTLILGLLLASCGDKPQLDPVKPGSGEGGEAKPKDASGTAKDLSQDEARSRVRTGRYLMDLANVHMKYREVDKAIDCYTQAIETEKEVQQDATLHYLLGQAYKQKNDKARSTDQLEKSIEIYMTILGKIPADDTKTDRAYYYERIGLIYRELGKEKEAVEWAEKIATGDKRPGARVRLARLYTKMGFGAMAVDTYKSLIVSMKDQKEVPLVKLEYGSFLAQQGNTGEAKSVLEPLLKEELPERSAALLKKVLLEIYQKTGELDKIKFGAKEADGGDKKDEEEKKEDK